MLCLGELGGLPGGGLVKLLFLLPGGGHVRLKASPAGADGRLIGLLALQLVTERYVVIREQPQPRVAQLSLDDVGPPGDLRLPAKRLEAPVQLRGEVHQPGEVGLHRVQFAKRLLLAPAVLQDAGGLLDNGPARLKARVQDLIKLALPHDDVHLAAQPAIGQQVLDVQQTATVAIDGVLALPGAEHQPADRHLGIVDRQRAVAVVDGEGDLGPARGARVLVPAKTTSSILRRAGFWPCSPMTQERASTMFDLPEPFGPTNR